MNIRLCIAKNILNRAAKLLLRIFPECQTATTEITTATTRAFDRIIRLAKFQKQQVAALDDENFIVLLKTLRNALVYLAENDDYYRGWLEYAALVFSQEFQRIETQDVARQLHVAEGLLQSIGLEV